MGASPLYQLQISMNSSGPLSCLSLHMILKHTHTPFSYLLLLPLRSLPPSASCDYFIPTSK